MSDELKTNNNPDTNKPINENQNLDNPQVVEEVSNKEKQVKYKRVDFENGYMTDKSEIENFKVYQHRDVIESKLIGDFNEDGDYIIDPIILKGLVSLTKIVDSEYKNNIFAHSKHSFSPKGNLQFSITISQMTEKPGYSKAILRVLEPVKKIDGYIQNTNSYILAGFSDVDDENFLPKVYKVFAIKKNTDNGVYVDNPEVVNAIMQRLSYLSKMNELISMQSEIIEQQYYLDRIEILKNPKYAIVLTELDGLMKHAKMFLKPDSPKYYAHLNELLDIAIERALLKIPELAISLKQELINITNSHSILVNTQYASFEAQAKQVKETVQQVNNEKTSLKQLEKKKEKKKAMDKRADKGKGGGGGKKGGNGGKDQRKNNSKVAKPVKMDSKNPVEKFTSAEQPQIIRLDEGEKPQDKGNRATCDGRENGVT